MKLKLENCPFCGGKAEAIYMACHYRIVCLVCNAMKIIFTRYKSQAYAEWNQRTP
jgi:uncharacterized protein (UPF0212 family)